MFDYGSNNTNKLSPQGRFSLMGYTYKVQIIQINLALKNLVASHHSNNQVQIIQINLALKNLTLVLLGLYNVQIIQINLALKNQNFFRHPTAEFK